MILTIDFRRRPEYSDKHIETVHSTSVSLEEALIGLLLWSESVDQRHVSYPFEAVCIEKE